MSQKDITAEPKGAFGFFGAVAPIMSIAFIPMLGAVQPAVCPILYVLNEVCVRLLDCEQFHSSWSICVV